MIERPWIAPRLLTLNLTLTLTLACGDDGGTTGAEGSSTGSSATSTGSTTAPGTTTSDETSAGSSTAGSSTTNDSADSGSTTAEPTTGDGSTTVGIDPDGLSFFATSVGSGDAGGDLGGLEGADATCQALADAVGEGARTWHAYLSTSTVDARDRIGDGPWYNAAGDMVATDVEALHTNGLSNGDPQHVLDENGDEVPGNEHDILTGSEEDGTYFPDATCDDWTSSGGGDQARVGHSDIPGNPMFSPSWNSAHTVGGCRAGDLQSTGGAGRLYCFAID
ncbi:hypothetical protein [Paraliomyxa miuraensis]|uniref:hypothetical protein n=1 Tax=Paraliomyxa miuraensis TaxID=376150 RepID=UPI002253DFBE|nr:hypothetical protein [Paraliomyxa miuraensis]MCX4239372.1 hypothetical protein [Paraliomyxa miuraensis]